MGPGAQEWDLGISRGGLVGQGLERRGPGVGLWELGSLIQLVLCFQDMCICRKPEGGRDGHNHVGSL